MTEEKVGSLAQEAMRLARVLAAQAAEGRAEAGAGDGADRDGAPDVDAHPSGTCDYCPLCQLIAVVRNARPEVAEHLTAALASLTLAARGVVESWAQAPGADGSGSRRAGTEDGEGEDDGWH